MLCLTEPVHGPVNIDQYIDQLSMHGQEVYTKVC